MQEDGSRFNLRFNLRKRVSKDKDKTPPRQLECKKKTAKTSAQLQQDYRNRVKTNPVVYKAQCEYDNIRIKVYKATLSEEKKEQYRKKTRERLRKFRAKKKADGIQPQEQRQTRGAQERQKKKWRTQKAEQRALKSCQTVRRDNERRRTKYAEKKRAEQEKKRKMLHREQANSKPEDSTHGYSSRRALMKAVRNTRSSLPTCSSQAADIITVLVSKASPTCKRKLLDHCIVSPNSKKGLSALKETTTMLKRTMQGLSKQRNAKAMQTKRLMAASLGVRNKYLNMKQKKECLGFSYKGLKRVTSGNVNRKRRSDCLSLETINNVDSFFNRCDVSRALPDARSASTKGNIVIGRMILESTLKTAYDNFLSENPENDLSFSSFKKLKPNNVLTMNKTKREACLCEYCINIDFKLRAISTFSTLHQLSKCAFRDRYELSSKTLCDKEGGEYKKECVARECLQCGVKCLDPHFKDLLDQYGKSAISWYRWEMGNVTLGTQSARRMCKVPKQGPIADLILELKREVTPFAKHLFNANWQWRQYNNITTNLPDTWVVFCMDFAENYTCRAQDEAQGAHWSNVQCTIHPVVATYNCPVDGCQQLVTDSIFFISDDIKHCQHAVHHYNALSIRHVDDEGIPIGKLIHFTDGAPTQYKSRINFADASFSNEDFGFSTEKHFFGSRHGKGPCDREIGVLKKQVRLAVNARRAEVSNAFDLYEYGRQNLTRPKVGSDDHVHAKRKFLYVASGEINRDRNERVNVIPLKGTHQLHSVCGVKPFIVRSRELSCFCENCTNNRYDQCEWLKITGPITEMNLQKVTCKSQAGKLNQLPEDHKLQDSSSSGKLIIVTIFSE